MNESKRRPAVHLERLLSITAGTFLVAALLAGEPLRAWGKGPPKKTSLPEPATLYNSDLQLQGSVQLAKGDIPGAALTFCRMLVPPGSEDMWTLSVVLLCDPADVWGTVKQITGVQPVFIQEREYKGQKCYRVCAGLSLDRNEPLKWKSALPPEFLAQKPFPAKVLFPCGTDGGQAEKQEKPSGPWEALEPVRAEPSQAPKPQPAAVPQAPAPPPAAKGSSGSPFWQPPLAVAAPGLAPQSPVSEAKRKEAEALFERGLAALQKGDRREAERYYQKALEADPGRPEVLNNLGVLYLEQERFDKAQKVLEQAVARAPSYGRAHLNLAGAFWGQNRKDEAISEAKESVALDPSDLNAHLTLASFFLAVDRKGEAAVEAKRALALDPQNIQAKIFLDHCPKE